MNSHEDRLIRVAKKTGYNVGEVRGVISFFFSKMRRFVLEEDGSNVRFTHIGMFMYHSKERRDKIKRAMMEKKEMYARDKTKHKKHIYLQRRVQAL